MLVSNIKSLSPNNADDVEAALGELNQRRRRAVELRLSGHSLAHTRAETGLSAPTIIAAYKAFLAGGWPAIAVKGRGRAAGVGRALSPAVERTLQHEAGEALPATGLWTPAAVRRRAEELGGVRIGERTAQRYLERWSLQWPALRDAAPASRDGAAWFDAELPAIAQRAHAERATLLWCADAALPSGARVRVAQTLRGGVAWLPTRAPNDVRTLIDFLARLRQTWPGPLVVLLHGVPSAVAGLPPDGPTSARGGPGAARPGEHSPGAGALADWIVRQPGLRVLPCPVGLPLARGAARPSSSAGATASPPSAALATPTAKTLPTMKLTHLQRLEAESIHILREVVAECERPVMLYSIGKDSACMLHLARKAFYPAPPPFPLLHVDTTWKFRDMYALRERMAEQTGMELLVWQNPEAKALGINPFDHGSQIHTDMWKTQGLKQALAHYGFDAAFGGARRDEEKSRAKERVFSFRSAQHRWDPKQQRPELWHLYNARKQPGESMRVFPLSNWTELDIWQYIHLEKIPIVPLYFARERPVVERDGTLIMVDDERMRLKPGEVPVMRKVRFRTLGCYPLSGAIESDAEDLTAVIQEMLLARTSERQGRLIDHDQAASMEKKKQEGYF